MEDQPNANALEAAFRQQAQAHVDSAKTFNDVLREYARAKIQQIDIHNYNGANLAYNHASDTANKLGLSDEQKLGVAPFPGHPNNTSVNVGGDSTERELLDRLERLAQQEPPPSPPVAPPTTTPPAPEPGPQPAAKKMPGWLGPIAGVVGGAGSLGALLLLLQGLSPNTPPSPDPQQTHQEEPTDPYYDPDVGLEVEGVQGWQTTQ
jgi:hypothetical protein